MDWWRPAAAITRQMAKIPGGLSAARFGYGAMAKLAALYLARLPTVRSVFMTGTGTRPEFVAPGISDIDLFLLADVPTLADEVEVRSAIHRAHNKLRVAGPLFHNLDYLAVDDLPYMLAMGGTWGIGPWKQLIGAASIVRPPRPRRELEIEGLFAGLRRWTKESRRAVCDREGSPPWLLLRVAERLFMDVVAGCLCVDRLTAVATLARLAVERHRLEALNEIAEREALVDEREGVVAALTVMNYFADRLTSSWTESWIPASEPRPQRLEAFADVKRVTAPLVDHGFPDVALIPRGLGSDDFLVVAVASSSLGCRDIVAAGRRLGQAVRLPRDRFRWADQPVLVTPALWRAAALLNPAPLAGAGFALAPTWLHGGRAPLPPAPPADDLAALLRCQVVQRFPQLRGRLMRARHNRAIALAKLDHQLRYVLPALSLAQDRGLIAVQPEEQPTPQFDLERLASIREWVAGRRAVLAAELAARYDGVKQPTSS